jgi:PAT family beta-lactamase induction signal transducer AmpG
VLALVTAFASATQDIVIDAWRIEAADERDELGLLSSPAARLPIALLVTDALIIALARAFGWPDSYRGYGGAAWDRVTATWFAIEPAGPTR